MGLRISERALAVEKAKSKLELIILDFAIAHMLTEIELLQALASCQQGILKDMLRAERHPEEPDRPADVD